MPYQDHAVYAQQADYAQIKHYAEYCSLPPEINSDNLHNGVGGDSLLQAYREWGALCGGMELVSKLLGQELTALQAKWSGPAATQMTEAAASYQEWLDTFTEELNCTANQVEKIGDGYSKALLSTIHPSTIEMLQLQMAEAVQQAESGDLAAIQRHMTLESEYDQMFATDVSAMEYYDATVNAALAALPSLTGPPPPHSALPPAGSRSRAAR